MKTIDLHNKSILISRTDSIGDVVLTLPVCIWLKQKFPTCRVYFLASAYTEPVISCFPEVDSIIRWDELKEKSEEEQIWAIQKLSLEACVHIFPRKEIARLVKKAGVPYRIGTSHRSFHWFTCNIRPNFTRKHSDFHESQLNFELMRPLGIEKLPSLEEISGWCNASFQIPSEQIPEPFAGIKNAVILHPKSQGSALEWPIEKYVLLAEKLLEKGETVVFSGTEKEGLLFRELIPTHKNCFDATGKMSLRAFIAFIAQSKTLVACSTGPLHIAGISGIGAIGLFSSRRPIHPGRWKALGQKVQILENDPGCSSCKKGEKCSCLAQISVDRVLHLIP
ncbi:MAG: glycosyltransferase family 9 protein [Bacteroidota bacterium]